MGSWLSVRAKEEQVEFVPDIQDQDEGDNQEAEVNTPLSAIKYLPPS